jgi:hypothetical protein
MIAFANGMLAGPRILGCSVEDIGRRKETEAEQQGVSSVGHDENIIIQQASSPSGSDMVATTVVGSTGHHLWQKQGSEDLLPTMSDALDRSCSGPSSATPQILHPDCKNADKQNVEGGDRSFSTQFPVQIDHQKEFVLLRHQTILQQVVAESSSTFHDKMLDESSKFIREEEPVDGGSTKQALSCTDSANPQEKVGELCNLKGESLGETEELCKPESMVTLSIPTHGNKAAGPGNQEAPPMQVLCDQEIFLWQHCQLLSWPFSWK